jgi:SAM-dependent methyltransferase
VRACPVCDAPAEGAALFLEERLDPAALSQFSFASRKAPEFMNHRLVRCAGCDLVYVSDPPPASALAEAYHEAAYDSAEEAADAARTYLRALEPVLANLPRRGSALEIGTGTGALLELLAQHGFAEVCGVEPSVAAIAAAPDHRRSWIRRGVFDERDFAAESFDLICCLMTLEHVPDPRGIAPPAEPQLRPRGAFVSVTHDYRAPVNRVLGRRSPIIDVEHMQLFSRRSIAGLLGRAGFCNVSARALVNSYAVSYWMRLSPLPARAKAGAQRVLSALRVDGLKIPVNVGNVVAVGYKQASS